MLILPLAFKLELLSSWPVIACVLVGESVHWVHPYTPLSEILSKNHRDRGSTILMMLSGYALFIVGLLDYAYWRKPDPTFVGIWSFVGGVVAALGFGIRVWTVRVLGSYFTARVKLEDDHQIINVGPYRAFRIRHPAYLGTLLSAASIPLFFRSYICVVLFLVVLIPAYVYRIHVEETALKKELGESYTDFSKTTWRLVPFVY